MTINRQTVPPGLVLAAILFLSAIFSFNFKANSFPDELAHLGYVADVANQGFPDYRNGVVVGAKSKNYLQHPPLYYMLVGAEYRLIGGEPRPAVFLLRTTNWMFLAAFFACIAACLREFDLGALDKVFAFLVVAGVPMVPALGGALSNDPLSFMGCALFFWGLLRWHLERNFALDLMLIGGVVAALSKATSASVIVCLALAYICLFWKETFLKLRQLSPADMIKILAAIGLVGVFYASMYLTYGRLFPRSGNGPALNFSLRNPDAPRRDLLQMMYFFIAGNVDSLQRPYGHVRFADLGFRDNVLRYVLGAAMLCGLFGLYRNWNHDRRTARLILSILLGTAFFFSVYFVNTYSRHLATGYPGGIQARYGFGLLPAFAFVAALGYSRIGNRYVRGGLVGLAAVPFLALFYTAVTGDLPLR
ncbi:DUF2142 domain-containing protein [Corticibacterium sp. UT-5YL-CI-8]|nr:DUF2142 domain-containing protein [Tianweitania sp. UT-5YL-CI-8]